MPPRNASSTGRQPALNSNSKGMRKNPKAVPPQENTKLVPPQENPKLAPPQRNTRSRTLRSAAVYSPTTPVVNPTLPKPISASFADPQKSTKPLRRTQKREYVSEDECSNKRRRRDFQSVSTTSQPLTKANLRAHNRLTRSGISDEMGSEVGLFQSHMRKRLSSQLSGSVDVTEETTSVRSRVSYTAARYRHTVLKRAKIFIQPGSLPEMIQTQVNTIMQHEISIERKLQLLSFAEKLCEGFVVVFDGASREDDCTEPIYQALDSMDSGKKFGFPRKADWDPSLKPNILPTSRNWNHLDRPNDDSVNRPTKRKKKPQATTPPHPPPALPKQGDIKNPRPDITVGFRYSTVTEALVARGLDDVDASDFLLDLQQEQKLCSDPAQGVTHIRFPMIVLEGKAYATGKPVFEAQNQAAISGSCMTMLQHNLANLTKNASRTCSDASTSVDAKVRLPLAFSICTEGPHIELWVHYTVSKTNSRMYNMNILKTCHACHLESVVEFLMAVDSIMSWASGDFLNNVAEQLVELDKATRAQESE